MRELYTTRYNSDDFADVNMLYNNELIDTPTLSEGLTYLYGKDSEMFPLLTLTEGQNGLTSVKPKSLNDTQYDWNVMGRMKYTTKVVALANTNNTKPGLNNTSFEVYFEDDWVPRFYTLTSPDKQSQVRVQKTGVMEGNKCKYLLAPVGGTASDYISLENFQNGLVWSMGAPKIAASKSDGTTSNRMTPGKWTNQFGYYRFSKQITGNIANKVVNIQFDTDDNGTTNLWMPVEMKQFEIERRLLLEEELWEGVYNRDSNGIITLKDDETGEPIPSGAGIKEILKTTGQYDTYGTLTLAKIDSIINRLFANRVDDTPMELVFYTGAGGLRAFNEAIKVDAQANNYYYKLGQEEVMSGTNGYLSYGKYFSQYKTIDGHIITVKRTNLFDQGTKAQQDRAMGREYNGFPYESYNMVLLDMSNTSDGERNIQLVAEKGREVQTGIYKGMTPLPTEWAAATNDRMIATKKDEASYEVIVSQGITMKNYTTSYYLEFSY